MDKDSATPFREIMARNLGTFAADALGVISLVALLVVGLNLPHVL